MFYVIAIDKDLFITLATCTDAPMFLLMHSAHRCSRHGFGESASEHQLRRVCKIYIEVLPRFLFIGSYPEEFRNYDFTFGIRLAFECKTKIDINQGAPKQTPGKLISIDRENNLLGFVTI